jgi:hypothetical protein
MVLRSVLAVCLLATVASAEPMISSLDDVVKSTDIVIATYSGPAGPGDFAGAKLHVEAAIKGKLAGDLVAPIGNGHPTVASGARVVAFLGARHEWNFVGEAVTGLSLEDAVALRGFYDFNAHIVTPGLVTLDQLRGRIAGRPIVWHIEGALAVLADDGSAIVDSPWRLSIDVPENRAPAIRGIAPPNLPAPGVALGGSTVAITWSTAWPRPLEIDGKILGRRGDALVAQFYVRQPDVFRKVDVERYLFDANAERVRTRMKLVWDDGETWAVAIGGDEYTDFTMRDGKGKIVPWHELDVRDKRHIDGMTLAPPRRGVLFDTLGDDRVLLQEILRGPIVVTAGKRHGRLELVDVTPLPAVRAP